MTEDRDEVKRIVFLLLLHGAIAAVFGCAQVRDEDITRPWAEPQPWERNVGMPPLFEAAFPSE